MDSESGSGEGSGEEFIESAGRGRRRAKTKDACFMMCLGIVLFPCSLYLLGWNENAYVCANRRILYGEAHAREVGCNASEVTNEFAFFSCPLVTSSLQTFTPCTFNRQHPEVCQGQPAVQFTSVSGRQVVEMLQCKEHCWRESKRGHGSGELKCNYELAWSATLINAAEFKRVARSCPNFDPLGGNPAPPENLDMGTSVSYATDVLVGESRETGFTLNHDLVTQLYPGTSVNLTLFSSTEGQAAVAGNSQPWLRPLSISANNVVVTPDGQYLTTCPSNTNAALGCVRISFFRSNATNPSVMTRVASAGQTVAEEVPSSWGCSARQWQAILPSKLSKKGFCNELQAQLAALVWLVRIVGLLACWFSVYCCLTPIAAAADIVGHGISMCPCGGFIGDFLEGMVVSIICCLSCGIGWSSGFIVIAVVWLVMRPLIGGGLLVLALLLCGCVAAVLSQSARRTVKGGRAAAGANAPVDRNTAQRFLDALRSEYINGRKQAVANFLGGISPEEREALVPFKNRVRGSQDKESVIELFEVKWGLSEA